MVSDAGDGGIVIPITAVDEGTKAVIEGVKADLASLGQAGAAAFDKLNASAAISETRLNRLVAQAQLLKGKILELDEVKMKGLRADLQSAQLEELNAQIARTSVEYNALAASADKAAAAMVEAATASQAAYAHVGTSEYQAAYLAGTAGRPAINQNAGYEQFGTSMYQSEWLAAVQQDVAVAQSSFAKLSNTIEDAGDTLTRFGTRTRQVGMNLAMGVTLPITIAGAASISAASNFDTAMTQIFSQAGASRAEVDQLRGSVLDLAQITPQGPEELAKALFEIESVGIRGAQAMDVLKAATDGATIGQADLTKTAQTLTGAMVTGINGAQDAGETMKMISSIVGLTRMHMDEFTSAMSSGIMPVAKALGLSLLDIGSALGVMSNQEIPPQEGATRLRTTLSLIAAPGEQAKKVLASIGLGALDLATAMRDKGLIGMLELLKSKLEGFNDESKFEILKEAFGGARSGSALIALMNGLDMLKNTEVAVPLDEKNFEERLKAMQDTTGVQLGILKSRIQADMISLGDALAPSMLNLVDQVETAIDHIANAFNRLPEPMQKMIFNFVAIAAVAGPILIIFGAMASGVGILFEGIGGLITVMTGLGVALGLIEVEAVGASAAFVAMAAPVALIVAALAALGVAGFLLGTHFDEVKAKLSDWGGVEEAVNTAAGTVENTFERVGTAIKNNWADVLNAMGLKTPSWANEVGRVTAAMANWMGDTAFPAIENAWKITMDNLPGYVDGPIGQIESKFAGLVGYIQDHLGGVIGWAADQLGGLAEKAGDIYSAFTNPGGTTGSKAGQTSGTTDKSGDLYYRNGQPVPRGTYYYWDAGSGTWKDKGGHALDLPAPVANPEDFVPGFKRGGLPPTSLDLTNPDLGGGGGGATWPGVSGSDAADKMTKTEFGLISLAEAFKIFNAQTGSSSIPAFKAWLEMEGKLADATEKHTAQLEQQQNPLLNMIMALGAIRTHILEANETIEQFLRNEVFMPALNNFKSALDALFSHPTREVLSLELQKDQLQLQKLQRQKMGATDEELKGLDDQIATVQREIDTRNTMHDIMKKQAELMDKTLPTEQDLFDQSRLLGTAIGQTSNEVWALNSAVLYQTLAAINAGNAYNTFADTLRGGGTGAGNAVGGPAGGGFSRMNEGSSGSDEMVRLPSGSWVFSASQTRALLQGGGGSYDNHFHLSIMRDANLRQQVMQWINEALTSSQYGNASINSSTYAPE